jgi:hypothetical protein
MTRLLLAFVVGFCAVSLVLLALSPSLRGAAGGRFRAPVDVHLSVTP